MVITQIYQDIESLITDTLKQDGIFFTQGKFSGFGWLFVPYKCSTFEGLSPLIAIKQYDKAVHLYVMLWENGMPITHHYLSVFGKSMIGKSCIRIKMLTEERKEAIVAIVQKILQDYEKSKL